jgi:hypothetical protein
MGPPIPGQLGKIADWAEDFKKKSEQKDLLCFVRPSAMPGEAPFEFIKKKNFVVDFFENVTHAVKSFFSFGERVSGFAETAQQVKPEDISGVGSEKKIGKIFSSVQDLFHYLEQNETGWAQKALLKNLVSAENKLTGLFADCIQNKIKEQLQSADILFSDEGKLAFRLKDGASISLEQLLEQFEITEPSLRNETLKKLSAFLREDKKIQQGIQNAIVAFYEEKCGAISDEMNKVLTEHSGKWTETQTWMGMGKGKVYNAAKVNPESIEECANAIHEFEKSYVPFLEGVAAFFAQGSGIMTPETMEKVTTTIKGKYGSTWDQLRKSPEDNVLYGLIQNSVKGLSEFSGAIITGIEKTKKIPEERAGHIIVLLQAIIDQAEKIQKAVTGRAECEGINKNIDKLLNDCRWAQKKLSKRVPKPGRWKEWWKWGGDTIIIQGGVNVESGAVLCIGRNNKIINKPYAKTVQKVAREFERTQRGALQAVLCQALTTGVAAGIQGLALGGGVPGMLSLGIGSATAVLANSMIQTLGEKAGLPQGITTTIGLVATLATSAYTSQYVATYLQGKLPPLAVPAPQVGVPAPTPQIKQPTGYPAGQEPIGSKQMAEAYPARQKQVSPQLQDEIPPQVAVSASAPMPESKVHIPPPIKEQPKAPAVETCGLWCKFKRGAEYGKKTADVIEATSPALGAISMLALGAPGGAANVPGLGTALLQGGIPITLVPQAAFQKAVAVAVGV